MKSLLLSALAVVALSDGLATFLGVALMLKADNFVAFALSAVVAFFVLAITFSAKLIANRHSSIYAFLACVLPFAVAFDLLATFVAIVGFPLQKQSVHQIVGIQLSPLFSTAFSSGFLSAVATSFVTLVVSGSPILLSFLLEADVREPVSAEKLKAQLEDDKDFEKFLLSRRLLFLKEGKTADTGSSSPVLTVFSPTERATMEQGARRYK